jgi:hypothetical protein
VRIGRFVAGAALLAQQAAALPRVSAEVSWQGECDDRAALQQELHARGVLLTSEGDLATSAPLRLDVNVTPSRTSGWSATLDLRSDRGAQLRELQAVNCGELRKAVAWVLVVLAEEQARSVASSSQSLPARAAFPEPVENAPTPELLQPSELGPPTADAAPPAPPRSTTSGASFRLGTAFITAFGFAPSPALGPSASFEVRPSSRSPRFRFTVMQLTSLPFERDETTIDVERIAVRSSIGSNALWAPLTLSADAEVGRLTGTGRGSNLASGSEHEPWLAVGLSAKLDAPLIARALVAELGASFDYTPLEYAFRYRSGQELSTSGPIEGRAQLGLSACF